MLQLCISIYLNPVLRDELLILVICLPDNLYVRQQGCEDAWWFFEAKRGLRAKRFGKLLYNINRLDFITEKECVYCAVRTGSLYTASLTFSNSTFCPHSVFMYFVWISEQTAIISLYSINWLVCITETECVYCAVRTGSLGFKAIFVALYILVQLHIPYRHISN